MQLYFLENEKKAENTQGVNKNVGIKTKTSWPHKNTNNSRGDTKKKRIQRHEHWR